MPEPINVEDLPEYGGNYNPDTGVIEPPDEPPPPVNVEDMPDQGGNYQPPPLPPSSPPVITTEGGAIMPSSGQPPTQTRAAQERIEKMGGAEKYREYAAAIKASLERIGLDSSKVAPTAKDYIAQFRDSGEIISFGSPEWDAKFKAPPIAQTGSQKQPDLFIPNLGLQIVPVSMSKIGDVYTLRSKEGYDYPISSDIYERGVINPATNEPYVFYQPFVPIYEEAALMGLPAVAPLNIPTGFVPPTPEDKSVKVTGTIRPQTSEEQGKFAARSLGSVFTDPMSWSERWDRLVAAVTKFDTRQGYNIAFQSEIAQAGLKQIPVVSAWLPARWYDVPDIPLQERLIQTGIGGVLVSGAILGGGIGPKQPTLTYPVMGTAGEIVGKTKSIFAPSLDTAGATVRNRAVFVDPQAVFRNPVYATPELGPIIYGESGMPYIRSPIGNMPGSTFGAIRTTAGDILYAPSYKPTIDVGGKLYGPKALQGYDIPLSRPFEYGSREPYLRPYAPSGSGVATAINRAAMTAEGVARQEAALGGRPVVIWAIGSGGYYSPVIVSPAVEVPTPTKVAQPSPIPVVTPETAPIVAPEPSVMPYPIPITRVTTSGGAKPEPSPAPVVVPAPIPGIPPVPPPPPVRPNIPPTPPIPPPRGGKASQQNSGSPAWPKYKKKRRPVYGLPNEFEAFFPVGTVPKDMPILTFSEAADTQAVTRQTKFGKRQVVSFGKGRAGIVGGVDEDRYYQGKALRPPELGGTSL